MDETSAFFNEILAASATFIGPIEPSDGFIFPLGDGSIPTDTKYDKDGWYRDRGFGVDIISIRDGKKIFHLGDDWNYDDPTEEIGLPVMAASNGLVVYAQDQPSASGYDLGNVVVIMHVLPSGEVVYTLYAHLESIDVQCGQEVDQGDVIGGIGDSGLRPSDGAHLHFEIFDVDYVEALAEYGYSSFNPRQAGSGWYDPITFITTHQTFTNPASSNTHGRNGTEVTLSFDDVSGADPNNLAEAIGSDYFGFDFSDRFLILAPDTGDPSGDSGYTNGLISGEWVAFNSGGAQVSISSDTDFDLISGYFTSAWNTDLILEVYAYDNNRLVAQDTLILDTDNPTYWVFDSDFSSIDEIIFISSGGVDSGNPNGSGTQFVLDDLSFMTY